MLRALSLHQNRHSTSTCSRGFARRLLAMFSTGVLATGLLAVSGCTGMQPGDGGPEPVCEGGGDLGIAPGRTGVDFQEFLSGDVLPTWDRPQGGVGTRINVQLDGVSMTDVENRTIDLIQTIIVRPLPGPPGGTGENGGDCSIDLDGNAVCNDEELSCVIGTCREVVTDQVNRQFPGACVDGKVVITEMPVRFRTRVELSEVDGETVELMMRLDVDDSDDEFLLTDPIEIEMEVGDFIQPSWWDG